FAQGRLIEACNHAQRGGLAAARAAEEGVKGAALDLEAQVIDGLEVPVVLLYVAELDIVFVATVAHHAGFAAMEAKLAIAVLRCIYPLGDRGAIRGYEGREEAGHSTLFCRQNVRIRHRRNLRQLPPRIP
nr:hypothetical protein [Tanacetum cinerariifolium]